MTASTINPARARVLDTAHALFEERGYQGVSMRDLARALGMREASLYYHAPGGKEELYLAAQSRGLQQYGSELAEALRAAPDGLEAQLLAAAAWVLARSPLPLPGGLAADLQALSAESRETLLAQVREHLYAPVAGIFQEAAARAEWAGQAEERLAWLFLAMLESAMQASQAGVAAAPFEKAGGEVVALLLEGLSGR